VSLPTKLSHTLHEKVWGSTHLSPWFPDTEKKTGEIWFDAPPDVPLLIKFLFTTEFLSVQVHPKDDYAREHHDSSGKTEMWHILRATPGAKIALGLRREVSREQLREASLSGAIMDLLNWIEVQPGDTFYTPAGTIHAIGAGIGLCEIQQISDITYRLYDYGRDRELHLEHGLAVSDLTAHKPVDFATCEYFRTTGLKIVAPSEIDVPQPSVLIAVLGEGTIEGMPYRLGEAWHVGKGTVRVAPVAPTHFLLTHVPPRYS
jgi:mannose-6-phosphate isomerase